MRCRSIAEECADYMSVLAFLFVGGCIRGGGDDTLSYTKRNQSTHRVAMILIYKPEEQYPSCTANLKIADDITEFLPDIANTF